MRRRSRNAGCFLLVGIAAGAQYTDGLKWPRVRVNVSIVDHNGAPAADVKRDSLEITDGKKAIGDAVLRPVGGQPESVCLVVDMSGSTSNARDAIRAELRELIQKLPEDDEVCLVDFSSAVYVDVPLTMDRAMVTDGLKYLKPAGGSALLDAVESTANMMQRSARYALRVIVLVSDGGENASKLKEEAVERDLLRPKSPVVYSLVNRGDTNPDEQGDRERLRKLTEATGGLAFLAKAEGDPARTVDDLVQAMRGQYELEFTAADPAADGGGRKLRVAPGDDLRKQKIKVVAPDKYVAAGQ